MFQKNYKTRTSSNYFNYGAPDPTPACISYTESIVGRRRDDDFLGASELWQSGAAKYSKRTIKLEPLQIILNYGAPDPTRTDDLIDVNDAL